FAGIKLEKTGHYEVELFYLGMAKPLRLPGIEEQHLLDGLEIELVAQASQQDRWNQLVVEQHYLHNATLVGEQLRYVVSYQKQWLALLGWSAAAWHLKLREAWLGWWQRIFMWPMSGPNNSGCGRWKPRRGVGFRHRNCRHRCKPMKSRFSSAVSFLLSPCPRCESDLGK